MKYEETSAFQKDFKRLLKRYKTLEEDLETVKKNAIELFHIHNLNNQSTFPIPGFCSSNIKIHKVKKFACKSLQGRGVKSGMRLIYAFHKDENKAVFLEIYFKGDKVNEDKERIKDYMSPPDKN